MRSFAPVLAAATVVLPPGVAIAAPALPDLPEDATELIACSQAQHLKGLGLLDVPDGSVRLDAPLAQIRARGGRVLWSRWTPGGTEEPTISSALEEPSEEDEAQDRAPDPAPLLDRIDDRDGCWLWAKDPAAVGLFHPDASESDVWLTAGALEAVLSLDLGALTPPLAVEFTAPRTPWHPEAITRFNTHRSPIPPPKEGDPAFSPNAMVQMVFNHCPEWTPGTSMVVAGAAMALLCPTESPRAALKTLVKRSRAGGLEVEATDISARVRDGFILLSEVVAVEGGLAMTNDAQVFSQLLSAARGEPEGEPWWSPDAPNTGIWTLNQQTSVHVVPDGDVARARLNTASLKQLALLSGATEAVTHLDVDAEPRGVIGGVTGEVTSEQASLETRTPAVKRKRPLPRKVETNGECTAVFVVDTQGVPESVEMRGEACPPDYAQEAQRGLLLWRFDPETGADGQPIRFRYELPIKLRAP